MKYFETPNHIMGAVNNAAGQGGMGQFWESQNMEKKHIKMNQKS